MATTATRIPPIDSVRDAARQLSAKPWRVVEAQNRVPTMRLVDTLAEQSMLEDLLEGSKPPLPAEAARLHYLLATPFRYAAPPPAGSRFRGIGDAGVWYGANVVETAIAEVAYWRLRFLRDSPLTPDLLPVPHTAFRASVFGSAIVLQQAPFERQHKQWEDPVSYDATQALARVAREAGIALIRYRSVRDPEHRPAIAVLTPKAFRKSEPLEQHTWLIKVARTQVLAEANRGGDRLAFAPEELGLRAAN
jgi:hypothetical protein